MSVELKILVPLDEWQLLKKTSKTHESCSGKSNEEWERLKHIEQEHQKCLTQLNSTKTNNLSTVDGAGTTVDESGDHRDLRGEHGDRTFTMPPTIVQNEPKNIDGDANSFEKNVVVDKATEGSTDSNPIKALSKSEIIQHIQEKFQNDASTLLDKLDAHPLQFLYDSNGILSIFCTNYPGKEIFNFSE